MSALGSIPAKPQQLLVAGVGALLTAVLGRTVPAIPDNIDPVVYHRIIGVMRRGTGFYPAIDEVFRAHGMGPVDSFLAVRSPLGFQFLTLLGDDRVAWLAFLAAVTVAAVLLARVLDNPIAAVFVIVFFSVVGQAAWTAPELWASVLVVAAVALALDERWIPAVATATVATSVRELAVLVLVGIALARWRSGRTVAPMFGFAAAAVFYLIHWNRVAPYLVPPGQGRQATLLGTGSFPTGVLTMMGTWLPAGGVVGPVLFVAALAWAHRRGRLALIGPVLALVLTGLLVNRPEWATFVVPLTLALGLDELGHHIARWRWPALHWRGANRSPAAPG